MFVSQSFRLSLFLGAAMVQQYAQLQAARRDVEHILFSDFVLTVETTLEHLFLVEKTVTDAGNLLQAGIMTYSAAPKMYGVSSTPWRLPWRAWEKPLNSLSICGAGIGGRNAAYYFETLTQGPVPCRPFFVCVRLVTVLSRATCHACFTPASPAPPSGSRSCVNP